MFKSINDQTVQRATTASRPFSPLLRGARTPQFERSIPIRQIIASSATGAAELTALIGFVAILCSSILAAAATIGG